MNIKRIALLSVAMSGLFSTSMLAYTPTASLTNETGETYVYGLIRAGYVSHPYKGKGAYTWRGPERTINPGNSLSVSIPDNRDLIIVSPDDEATIVIPTRKTKAFSVIIRKDGIVLGAGSRGAIIEN